RVRSHAGRVGAVRAGQLDLVGGHVDAEDAAASGFEQLHGELAYQAETDHHTRLAEPYVGNAHALQRDRADGDKRRVLEVDRIGHADGEVSGDGHHLGVVGL